jgi:hypothetical protein
MSVIGFNFLSFDAKVNEEHLRGTLDVKNTPLIEDVKEKKLDFLGPGEAIGIKFRFSSNYGKAGEIKMNGEVIYKTDAKQALRKWEKEKKLDDEIVLNVLNFLLNKCMIKSVELADALRLPPPLQFPHIVKDNEKKE